MTDDYDELVRMRAELWAMKIERAKRTTTVAVTAAKEDGLELSDPERYALWCFARGGIPITEFVEEE